MGSKTNFRVTKFCGNQYETAKHVRTLVGMGESSTPVFRNEYDVIDQVGQYTCQVLSNPEQYKSISWSPDLSRMFEIARREFVADRWHAAAELFLFIVESDNLFVPAFLGLSRAHLALGNLKLAILFGRQASVLDRYHGSPESEDLYRRYLQMLDKFNGAANPTEPLPSDSAHESNLGLPQPIPPADWEHWPVNDVPHYSSLWSDTRNQMAPGPRNRHGFRCDSLDERKPLNVLSIGCSWTEGWEVGHNEAWPSVVCNKLANIFGVPVNNWNLGHAGKSMDYMARMTLTAVPHLKPDVVMYVFTTVERREYFTRENACLNYSGTSMHAIDQGFSSNPVRDWRYVEAMDRQQSKFDNLVNFLKNFYTIEAVLRSANIPWGYSFMGPPSTLPEQMGALIKANRLCEDNFVGFEFDMTDVKPGGHPGPESHQLFGLKIADWLMEAYHSDISSIIAAHPKASGAKEKVVSFASNLQSRLLAKSPKMADQKRKIDSIYPLY